MAEIVSKRLKLPVISKDTIKELLFDSVGFQSRAEKVKLGIASMEILYYAAGQLMKAGQPFILENNFEYSSEHGMRNLLEKYQYSTLTITLTGDYNVIYQRFLKRESSPDRHRGHVVFVRGIEQRGFDAFCVDGRRIMVDTTDFSKINMEKLFSQIEAWKAEILHE